MLYRMSLWLRLAWIVAAASVIAFAIALSSGGLAFASSDDAARQQPSGAATAYSGVITDSVCGARHTKYPNLDAVRCTRECVRTGAKYTLINGDKVYFLQGDFAELAQFAGQRAVVTGALQGETIKIASIDSPHQ